MSRGQRAHSPSLSSTQNPCISAREGTLRALPLRFSFVANATGNFIFGFYNGNNLDNPADAGDDPAQNPFTVALNSGEKYFFSFEDDDGGQVKVFVGNSVDLTPPISSLANQGYDAESAFLITPGSNGQNTEQFAAGDELIGGNGADKFLSCDCHLEGNFARTRYLA